MALAGLAQMRDESAVMLRDIFGTLTTCLGVSPDLLDGDWVDELAADMADEWSLWSSAAAVMADWTYPIETAF